MLASQQKAKASIGKLPDDATTRRVKLIEDYLKRADSIKASIRPGDPDENKKRKDVRVMCREVIDLYENETGNQRIVDLVKRARDLLASATKR